MNYRSPIVAALASVLLVSMAAPASAQAVRNPEDREAARQAKQQRKQGDKAAEATASKFPEAKRKAPEQKLSEKGSSTLQAIFKLYQANQFADAIAKAEEFGASTHNAYEKSAAYQLAGTAAAQSKDNQKAALDFQQALEANGLDNDQHYTTMYNLAVTQYQLGQYDAALATLDRYLAETGTDPAPTEAMRATLLVNTNKAGQAASTFEQEWRRNPADAKALNNAAVLYQQNKQYDKAEALLLDAKAKGQLDAEGFRALYVAYLSDGKDKQALATIDEALATGKLVQDDHLANAYVVLAQNAYGRGETKAAEALYRKAAPIAADGEPALNLARVLVNEGRLADAKKAAQQALDKGLKNPDDAKKILAKKGK